MQSQQSQADSCTTRREQAGDATSSQNSCNQDRLLPRSQQRESEVGRKSSDLREALCDAGSRWATSPTKPTEKGHGTKGKKLIQVNVLDELEKAGEHDV